MIDRYAPGLPRTIHFSIANLHFNISSRSLPIVTDYDASYKDFLASPSDPSADCMDISLHEKADMPGITHCTKIFETPESWQMLSDTTDKYIVFQSPDSTDTDPEWTARIDSNRQNINVFCNKKQLAESSNELGMANPVRYPLDQILLIHCLVGKGILIHAAGIVVQGKGCLFAGPSGAGKTTISGLFQNQTQCTILSDDRMVIRKPGPDFLMYGTPWPGEAGIAINESAALRGIFFLKHGTENRIKELSLHDFLDNFFKVSSLPLYDEKDLQKSMDFCEDLLQGIKAYELNFKPGPEIIDGIRSCLAG